MSNYYVSGCVSDGDSVSTCDDDVAQFWTLYHRNDDGLSESIIDCMFREDAEAAMRVYEQRDALAAENAVLKDYLKECSVVQGEGNWKSDAEKSVYVPASDWMPKTPATDAYINSVRAEGAEMVKSHPAISLCSLTHVCEEIAAQLRTGKDGE